MSESVLDDLLRFLKAECDVVAAWLTGSFATGVTDPSSDVDVTVIVDDDVIEGINADPASGESTS